jgi:hypothetical protein
MSIIVKTQFACASWSSITGIKYEVTKAVTPMAQTRIAERDALLISKFFMLQWIK